MRVVRNDEYIQRRVKFTQRGSLVGMGLLIVALVLSVRNQPTLTLISWGLLLVGFIVAMASVQMGGRYVRPPRADMVIDKLLKGLDSRYIAYHYYYPAEHLLLTPSGLIAIQAQGQQGHITVRGKRWRHGPFWQRLRVLFGDLPLGNPSAELRRSMAATSKAIAPLGEQLAALPLDGLVVCYGKAELTVENPEFATVPASELKAKVRELAEAHPALGGARHKLVAAALRGESVESEA